MTHAMTVHSHADSPSVVRHWLDKARRSIGLGTGHMTHVAHHGLHSVQQYGEAGIVGALLGAAAAYGKDEYKGIRLDLGIAAAGLALPVLPVDGFNGLAADARNAGSAAFACYMKDKVKALILAKRGGVHGAFAGEEDPILAAGR